MIRPKIETGAVLEYDLILINPKFIGDTAMQKQKDMENAMLKAHRDFITGLNESVKILENDIDEADQMEHICTDEWCLATEHYIDELHKNIYSISEPRWAMDEDSKKIKELRKRIKKLYSQFEQMHHA